MDNQLYSYSPLPWRPPLRWPGGKTVAVYIGLNVEHYHVDARANSISPVTAGLVPDPMNYGWRDYAPRVGIWRLIELLDELQLRPSVLLNSEVCDRYPQIIEAGIARQWTWLAHGSTNSKLHTGLGEQEERAALTEMLDTIEAATHRRPKGWLGPALTETFETPRLLSELGLSYVLDWCCDDQPFRLNVPGMLSVPYSIELNDITLFADRNLSGPEYERLLLDQLEQLVLDGALAGRVMAIPLHPFIISQPFRHKYLARALRTITQSDDVWMTTSDEIADYYVQAAEGSSATAKPGVTQ